MSSKGMSLVIMTGIDLAIGGARIRVLAPALRKCTDSIVAQEVPSV